MTTTATDSMPQWMVEAEEGRRSFIMGHLPAHLPGLEIAPYFHPVSDRSKHDVFYVDCIDNDEIQRKAAVNPGSVGREVPWIDAVWVPGKRLAKCIEGRRFGYCIASHVLEHVPNPLGWLQEILECVEVGGRVAILLPHKAFTMDYYRPLTTFAQVVGWSIEKPSRPTATQVMDFLSQSFYDDGSVSFAAGLPPFAEARRHYSDTQSVDFARHVHATDTYLDVHCTVWTPESFVEIFRRIRAAGLIDADVIGPFTGFTGSPQAEFLVYLEKTAPAA
ncbi:MAG: class I SAM-dependent methyltransferase [Planctomycetes bacterium]|nr:class I SAM-dependent methyltransferase [Planctomycetota bacterium]